MARWILISSGAVFLSACSSPFLTERQTRYDCIGGEVLEVRFLSTKDGNGSARLWRHLEREGSQKHEPISLRQAPDPRGTDGLYTNDTVRLRELGDEVLLEAGVMSAVRCRKMV